MLADFVAGWLAGGAGLLVGHPLDTVKARLQTSDVYSGIRDCFRQTLRNETVPLFLLKKSQMSGLYKGMLAPFLSVGFINSIFFASYGLTLKAFHPGDLHVLDRKDLPMLEILAASTVASFVQLLPNVPIEHVKTKLQVQRENAAHFWQSSASADRRPQYAGPLDCTLQILRRDGLTGLYRGGVPNMVRDVIGFVFYMPVYQVLLRFLHPRTNETCAQILAGGTAGSVSWFSICPVEVVKNRLQTSHAKTSWLTETRSIFRVIALSVRVSVFRLPSSRGRLLELRPAGLQMWLLLLAALLGHADALDNGLARTPPMGWMSWTAFYCETDCAKHPFGCINENLYMDMADRLAADGYRDAGYVGVHIDDCWMSYQRDAQGYLQANNSRFPSGIPALADYVHNLGLKFGIYEDYGTKTCGGYPGSYGYLQEDADIFARWNVDYLKLDGCNIDYDLMPIGYPQMSRYLNASGRPIVYSCSWPAYLIDQPDKVDYNVIAQYCNLWRNFDDINSSWKSIQSIINYYDRNQDKHIPTHGPGHWHDPDMLVIGNAPVTEDQARAQMSIWAIWSAPLIMSNDLRTIAPAFRDILLNREVIAVDQDPLGVMGRLVANTTDVGVYVKKMTPLDEKSGLTSFAFAVLNRNLTTKQFVEFQLSNIGLTNPYGYHLKDLWTGEDLGIKKPSDKYSATVNPTGAVLVKATLTQFAQPL